MPVSRRIARTWSKGGVPVCVCDIGDKPKRTDRHDEMVSVRRKRETKPEIDTYLVSLQHVRVAPRAFRARSRSRGRVLLGR